MCYTESHRRFTVWQLVDFKPRWEEGWALLSLNIAGAGSIDEAIRLGMIQAHTFADLERLRRNTPHTLGGCGTTDPTRVVKRLLKRVEDVRLEDFRVEATRRRKKISLRSTLREPDRCT